MFLWDKGPNQSLNVQDGTCQNCSPVGMDVLSPTSAAASAIAVGWIWNKSSCQDMSPEPLATDLQSYLGQWGRGADMPNRAPAGPPKKNAI